MKTASRDNNFDLLRVLAASAVLISHCFLLSAGKNKGVEPLDVLTDHQISGGRLGVFIFLVISGYLVTASYIHAPDPIRFLGRRSARIFPGLVGVLLFTVIVVGPLTTTLSTAAYFANPETWAYFRNLGLYGPQLTLPGVFDENPRAGKVNGSLWTLAFEFSFYLLVLVLGTIGRLRVRTVGIIYGISLGFVLVFGASHGTGLDRFMELLAYFAAGMLLRLWRPSCSGILAVVGVVAIVAAVPLGLTVAALATAGAYVVYVVALHPTLRLPPITRYGDFSYGVYLYAYPTQQAAVQALGPTATWWGVLVIAFPATLLLAVLSWHCIERAALQVASHASAVRRPDVL